MFNRNQKYTRSNRNNSNSNISINLDITTLQLFCNLVSSENRSIHKSHIMNLSKLINNLDLSLYENDIEKQNKLNFIRKGIEARLTYNLTKQDLILKHINGGFLDDNSVNDLQELNNDELAWINKMISESLKYGFIYQSINDFDNLINKFRSGDYSSKAEIVELFKHKIADIQSKFRQSDANASSELIFSLEDSVFDDCIRTVYDEVSSPSNKLITGMVGFNELLGGGFELERVYALFGLPSEGKSISMLDLAIQIKKYNPGYICKDPTKKPCIVYFTLENTLKESVSRLVEMVGIEGSMTDYSVEDLIRKLKTEGELVMSDASPINFVMIYKPGMSVDTSFLYTIVEDLEDRGFESIAFVIDYVKRIKSSYSNDDPRFWLGNVINEFKVFAVLKGLAVITASQLNRDATTHIDESRKANKSDLVRMLGRNQIGESMLMLENLDGAFLIAPEWTQEGRKYLGIQRIKKRYKASDLTYLYYPYANSIKLVEDFNALEPVYKTTMKDIPQNLNNLNHLNRINEVREIGNEVKFLPDTSNNIFLSGAMSIIDDSQPKLLNPITRLTP